MVSFTETPFNNFCAGQLELPLANRTMINSTWTAQSYYMQHAYSAIFKIGMDKSKRNLAAFFILHRTRYKKQIATIERTYNSASSEP